METTFTEHADSPLEIISAADINLIQTSINTLEDVATDGWTPAEDTWTYASASTFTISGQDRTSVLVKGTKLKLTQTTPKYFVVVKSAYAAETTTVTVAGGATYTLANATISANYYSRQAAPAGWDTARYEDYVIRRVILKTGLVDNTATEVATITLQDETGSTDGGVYTCFVRAIAVHSGLSTTNNAVEGGQYHFSRAQTEAGVGQLSAVVEAGETAAAESEGGTTKGIASVTMTVVETSEFVTAIKFTVDLDGNAVTTAVIVAEVVVIWYGFLTPPIIGSAA